MPNSQMQLGPIVLQDYEIPASIRFGGHQRLAVRALSGGGRSVERLGPDDGEIQFEGIFSGPDAELRAEAFDSLRISGQVVWLSWESFRRLVVVKSFVAEYRSPWWITFNVCCVVVWQVLAANGAASVVAGTVTSDLGNALAVAPQSEVSIIALQTALLATNIAVPGTSDQRAALSAVQVTLASLDNVVASQSALMAVVPPTTADAEPLAAYIANAANAAGTLASARAARCYVGRIGVQIDG